jgi:cation transport ATPase
MINFGVFFILNTGIEVKIVRRMHKELQEKRERQAKMNASSSSSSNAVTTKPTSTSKAGEDEKKEEEDRRKKEEDTKKERRVIKMVMLNCIFNFVLRAPDLLFWLEYKGVLKLLFQGIINYLVKAAEISRRSAVPGLFNIITDFGYFTYILTFTSNFIIFYNFNTNFKEAVVFFWTSAKPKTYK